MIKKIIEKSIWKIKAIIGGGYIAHKLIHKYVNKKMILTYSGVGDRVFMLAYLREYQRLNHINNIAIISADPVNPIYLCFGFKKEEIIPIPLNKMHMLNQFYWTWVGRIFLKNHFEILPVTIDTYIRKNLTCNNPGLRMSQATKAMYHLSQETHPAEFNSLSADRVWMEIRKNIKTSNKIVLMNPYANTCDDVSFSFFQKIADRLKDEGYVVLTSIFKEQKPLIGTYGIEFSIGEAVDLCNKCGIVIGVRSGFMDVISYSDANIIVVDNKDYFRSELFLLEACWTRNKTIKTYHWEHSREDELIDQIIDRCRL